MRNSSGSAGLALAVIVACSACGDRGGTHSTADRDTIATVAGDFAYVIGTYWETFTLVEGTTQQLQGRSLTGAAPQRVEGRFLFIMRRQPDASWKIARAIGADLPASS